MKRDPWRRGKRRDDAGLNWIDTAAVYGLGHSETVVARAIDGRHPKPYVFTKCERTWNDKGEIIKCLKRDSVIRECEDSLRRLRAGVIDLYQIHWPEPEEDIEEGWEAVVRLREQGKIRWAGLSNCNAAQIERVRHLGVPASLQPPYSLVSREIEAETLPYCGANGIGVIAYAPMRNGLLTGSMSRERVANLAADDFRRRSPHFQEPNLTRNLALVEKLRAIGDRHGRTPGEVAIAWTLRRPEVTGAIVGLRNAGQVPGVIGAATFRLSEAELAELET